MLRSVDETSRMGNATCQGHLPLIEKALGATGWMPGIPAGLRAVFRAEGDRARRTSNRIVILVLTLLFDLFWWPQWQSAPDIVLASGVLRLAVFTPCAMLFCVLDFYCLLGRFYEPALLCLALAPSLITAYLCLQTAEMLAQPEIYGTPLILLYTCILLRLHPIAVTANVLISTSVYISANVICPMLPQEQMATAIFIQVAVAAAGVIFSLQLETRDRRLFLLTQNERIRRSLVLEQNRGLLHQVQTDKLTGIANRRCFDETFSARWLDAMQARTEISLIMIDVDHFKKYNDTYGHVMGDACLQRVAAALSAGIRSTDVLARFGGEEFAVIIHDGSEQDAIKVANRLCTEVANMCLPHEGAGPGEIVTISVGLATAWPTSPHEARHLLEDADLHLYAAKQNGRNRVFQAPGQPVRLSGTEK
jgi:diguanylate cyclase (GGDEF)-like protein